MSIRKFQNGDVVIATSKLSQFDLINFNITPGVTRATVIGYRYNGYYTFRLENGKDLSAKSTGFEKGKPKSSIEVFEEQIDKAVAKIAATRAFIEETQNKIAFMQEVGSDQFDENEFKAYHTLTIIEQSDMSKIEKAKAIAALISGK
jgi:hypothetical protein